MTFIANMEQNFLYHYTSLESALNILKGKEGKICFWGSRHDCMDDPFDCEFAKRSLFGIFEQDGDVATTAMSNSLSPFIVSFCVKEDDFVMWRLYPSAEVCLIFDETVVAKECNKCNNEALVRCEYVPSSLGVNHTTTSTFDNIKKALKVNGIASSLDTISSFIKHEGFSNEHEKRWVRWLTDNGQTNQTLYKIKGNGKIAFYQEFLLSRKALRGIIVRNSDFDQVKKDLESALQCFSYEHFEDIEIKRTNSYPYLTMGDSYTVLGSFYSMKLKQILKNDKVHDLFFMDLERVLCDKRITRKSLVGNINRMSLKKKPLIINDDIVDLYCCKVPSAILYGLIAKYSPK